LTRRRAIRPVAYSLKQLLSKNTGQSLCACDIIEGFAVKNLLQGNSSKDGGKRDRQVVEKIFSNLI
jgi:hypothetical protein